MTSNLNIIKSNKYIESLRKRNVNTLQLLQTGLYLTWGTSLLLALTTIFGAQVQRHAVKTVGEDTAPSVLTAQQIKDSLADMGASAVNQLLVKPGENPAADKNFEYRRERLGKFLVQAAQNITYGDKEREPITNMVNGLTQYMLVIQQARDANARGDNNALLAYYYEAVKINEQQIQPNADALNKINLDTLNQTYGQQKIASALSEFIIVITGLMLLVVLIGTQLFLYRRMRRVINPMLLAATIISFIFISYTIYAIESSVSNLKVAKEDAFESLYALRQARALAYSANRDESRFLLDRVNATKYEAEFQEKINKIATLPPGYTFKTIIPKLANGERVDGFTGLIANEFKNITFAGEREAAVATINALDKYLNIDKQIRQLAASGKYAEAIKLCTGTNPGESDWAFKQFKTAHQKVLDINIKQFEGAIKDGFANVQGLEIIALGTAISISTLALFGLRVRMREYQ
ncbi:hypothetical protein NIES4071_97230 [Calothrix sp. NIES-4071]|nr:hypothetical protein NIES4071_97230 [Calothrix sp. NIES-4071]BAZ63988.1 hypothetical protein NIES4105_97160 [Calothrix sp. NIES-4105]